MNSDERPVADEETRQRIQASFDRQGLMAHLGASITEIRQGLVRVTLPYKPEVTQQYGFFHGGTISALADTAGGYAGFTLFRAESAILTVEFKINFLAPAQGPHIEAVGTVVKSGRTLTICQMEVFGITGAERTLVAAGQQTLICLMNKPEA